MRFLLTFFALILLANTALAQNDLRKTALKSTTPSDEIVRLDINQSTDHADKIAENSA